MQFYPLIENKFNQMNLLIDRLNELNLKSSLMEF